MACSKNEQRVQVVTHEYNGIDVSHHQGDICWSEVAKDKNIEFVYVKATEGATHLDKRYQTNFEGARKNGLKVGSYHYFRMTSSSHDQFRNFKSKVAKDEQQLIPMVDVETADKKNITETRDSLRVLLTLIEQYYGVKPMIYGTNRSYNEICGKDFLDYKAYIGRYGEKVPAINGPSSCHYYIWQYTENGKINGISKAVDLCRYHSDSNIEGLLYAKGVSKLSKTTEVNNVLVEERYGLNIYYPNFKHVKLVCGKMPSANDKNVLMCCEAAFTGELLSEFKHSNIAGNHVSDGKYHKGYRCKANTGCFAYFADTKTWTFAIGDYNKQLW